ncbi:hypothetical protein, partial [Xanthovirga aplysinae]|uniref:hypothetical protein n=1 Tax=Xanthovirga aplysinae TaxID=2529853 RepID=UPI0012BD33FC
MKKICLLLSAAIMSAAMALAQKNPEQKKIQKQKVPLPWKLRSSKEILLSNSPNLFSFSNSFLRKIDYFNPLLFSNQLKTPFSIGISQQQVPLVLVPITASASATATMFALDMDTNMVSDASNNTATAFAFAFSLFGPGTASATAQTTIQEGMGNTAMATAAAFKTGAANATAKSFVDIGTNTGSNPLDNTVNATAEAIGLGSGQAAAETSVEIEEGTGNMVNTKVVAVAANGGSSKINEDTQTNENGKVFINGDESEVTSTTRAIAWGEGSIAN